MRSQQSRSLRKSLKSNDHRSSCSPDQLLPVEELQDLQLKKGMASEKVPNQNVADMMIDLTMVWVRLDQSMVHQR